MQSIESQYIHILVTTLGLTLTYLNSLDSLVSINVHSLYFGLKERDFTNDTFNIFRYHQNIHAITTKVHEMKIMPFFRFDCLSNGKVYQNNKNAQENWNIPEH